MLTVTHNAKLYRSVANTTTGARKSIYIWRKPLQKCYLICKVILLHYKKSASKLQLHYRKLLNVTINTCLKSNLKTTHNSLLRTIKCVPFMNSYFKDTLNEN